MRMPPHFKLLAMPDMLPLAQRIMSRLGAIDVYSADRFGLAEMGYTSFASGEGKPMIHETVRRQDVYLLAGLQLVDGKLDPNGALMRLYLTIDALHRASVSSIFLVLPFLSYMRQDRKAEGREPISAKAVADLLTLKDSVTNLMTLDFHADQEQGFFKIPVDNLPGSVVMARHFRQEYQEKLDQLVVISPDAGGVVRATRFARLLGVPMYHFEKQRDGANKSKVVRFSGEGRIAGKDVVILDDMIDTGGTQEGASNYLRAEKVGTVHVAATHYIGSPKGERSAETLFTDLGIKVVTTESIPRSPEYLAANPWLTVLPLDDYLADALWESSSVGGSVSKAITSWTTK